MSNESDIVSIVGSRERLDVSLAVLTSGRPDCASDADELQRAVALTANRLGWFPVEACGVEAPAAEQVRTFGLEHLTERRRLSRFN